MPNTTDLPHDTTVEVKQGTVLNYGTNSCVRVVDTAREDVSPVSATRVLGC